MHLADAFIQRDLQCIQVIHFFSMCVPWELNPQPFALLTRCSTITYGFRRLGMAFIDYYFDADMLGWKLESPCTHVHLKLESPCTLVHLKVPAHMCTWNLKVPAHLCTWNLKVPAHMCTWNLKVPAHLCTWKSLHTCALETWKSLHTCALETWKSLHTCALETWKSLHTCALETWKSLHTCALETWKSLHTCALETWKSLHTCALESPCTLSSWSGKATFSRSSPFLIYLRWKSSRFRMRKIKGKIWHVFFLEKCPSKKMLSCSIHKIYSISWQKEG